MTKKLTAEELLEKAKKPAKLALAYTHSMREKSKLCQNVQYEIHTTSQYGTLRAWLPPAKP